MHEQWCCQVDSPRGAIVPLTWPDLAAHLGDSEKEAIWSGERAIKLEARRVRRPPGDWALFSEREAIWSGVRGESEARRMRVGAAGDEGLLLVS